MRVARVTDLNNISGDDGNSPDDIRKKDEELGI